MKLRHRCLGLLLLAAGLLSPAQAQTVKAHQLAPQTWMVQGVSALGSPANRNFISNASFVVTDAGVIVFDALGSPALAQEMLDEIRRITSAPIKMVVLTHYHADHIYGLQTLKAAGAQVIAHRDALIYLNSQTAELRLKASREELFPWIDEKTQLVSAERWITEPTTLRIGGLDFELIPAGPAHSPEDLVVYIPQLKVLIAGDLVFRGRVPFVGQADSGSWLKALDRLLQFDAKVIVPGHGAASTTAREDLQLTRDYLAYLRQTMGEAARNMEPFEDVYARTDWSRFAKLPLFGVANRINAYNTYLLMEREGQ
jgi:glyoxylase-like metal-dependent hydrolase (beta-lactamase superfamily II)